MCVRSSNGGSVASKSGRPEELRTKHRLPSMRVACTQARAIQVLLRFPIEPSSVKRPVSVTNETGLRGPPRKQRITH